MSDRKASKASVKNNSRKVSWLNRLFGLPLKKVSSGAPSDGPATTTAPPPEEKKQTTKKKKKTLCGLCDCFRRRNSVAPSPEDEAQPRNPREHQEYTNETVTKVEAIPRKVTEPKKAVTTKTDLEQENQQVHSLGFPNPTMTTCYMNSTLQSLLTLTEFVRDVSSQEEVWSLIPGPELILSHFIKVARCHSSRDLRHKLRTLFRFKKALSVQAPEFEDLNMKDAHEFLTAILYQMMNLAPSLQEVASFVGQSYSCPVESNLVFKMQNTRTCKSCGARSIREEVFTNLSLDVIPEGSVEEMLQEYQKETDLDFNCECGGSSSSQRSTFLTLPKVLILHLKRFRYTESLQIEKVCDPIVLLRELMVPSSQDERGLYRLVSVINHIGSYSYTGHYVSEGLHVQEDQDSPGDRWLHYNDVTVTETTVDDVCQWSKRGSFILFYQRQM